MDMEENKSSAQLNKPLFNGQRVLRQIFLILLDTLVIIGTSVFALLVRFEFDLADLLGYEFLFNVLKMLPISVVLSIVVFAACGLYNSLWEFAGEREMIRIGLASLISSVVHTLLLFMFHLSIPRSFVILECIFLFILTFFVRFSYRIFRKFKEKMALSAREVRRTMIIGAGDAGAVILRELQRSKFSQSKVVCLIDDDVTKVGKYMYGVPVVGTTEDIIHCVDKYKVEEIIFAIPSATAEKRSAVLDICSKTVCKLKILPGIYQLVNGEVNVQKIRDVQIEDLLFRESVNVTDLNELEYYFDKTILVTGGGGSVGSELCRQIARCKPRKLIIFEIYENNAYDLQQELKQLYGNDLEFVVEIGSVRDRERLEAVFLYYRPQVVFHAAAHKHVPLMEHSGCEAIKNNVFGTYNTADMADKYGALKFILISTDKAVNPTNVMGASKRLCEMVIQSRTESKTCFAAVRFGNVLGSNGSVIPLFKKQIAAGGPVTVTDKRIVRYFMTITEASQLVLEAGAMAKRGELFVLDMGRPVRIYDLAVNMIKLSGLKPDEDIAIEEVGLRPGEKLYEELLMKTENLDKTSNNMIFIERDAPLSSEQLEEKLTVLKKALEVAASASESELIKEAVRATVPTFKDPEELNRTAKEADEMKISV